MLHTQRGSNRWFSWSGASIPGEFPNADAAFLREDLWCQKQPEWNHH
jgi:hypothetical protein